MEKYIGVVGGLDESNNGKPFTIYTLVLSRDRRDVRKSSKISSKNRSLESKIPEGNKKIHFYIDYFKNILEEREYNFLLAQRGDLSRISRREFLGVVLASLLAGRSFEKKERLYILIDGNKTSDELIYAKDLISEVCGINREALLLKAGANFDSNYKPVNLAHKISYLLAQDFNIADLSDLGTAKYLVK